MSKPSQPILSKEFCHRVHVCFFRMSTFVYLTHCCLSSCPPKHAHFRCVEFPILLSNSPHSAAVRHDRFYFIFLYTLSINFVGIFLSHITPVVSLHFDQGICIVLLPSFSALPLAPMALSSPIFPSCLETSCSLNNYIGPSVSKPFCIGFLGFSVLSNPSKYVCHLDMISPPSVSI